MPTINVSVIQPVRHALIQMPTAAMIVTMASILMAPLHASVVIQLVQLAQAQVQMNV